ncbi:hypothetical protein A2U01_0044435 [Trifolium medium]|uniref:Uncharacterized protein n=1 Tax=Trifolium medium TaxID=97028 RepID=A0A392QH91_9FABA|nr:hypothetical protein [Trifolium medium]
MQKICTTSRARASRQLYCATRRYPLHPVSFEFCTGASRKPIMRDAQLPEDVLQLSDSTARRAIQGCATRNIQK